MSPFFYMQGVYGQKIARAFSALPPSLVVVFCGGHDRMGAGGRAAKVGASGDAGSN